MNARSMTIILLAIPLFGVASFSESLNAQCRDYQGLDPIGSPSPLETLDVVIEDDVAVYTVKRNQAGAGALYVYRNIDGIWQPELEVQRALFRFGVSVAISGDVIAVGSPGGRGSVFIFRYVGNTWIEEATLEGESGGDEFGTKVALDGDLLCVSAAYASNLRSGKIYMIRDIPGVGWVTEYSVRGGTRNGSEYGSFLDCRNDLVATGFADWDSSGPLGAADVYRYEGGTWSREWHISAPNITAISIEGDFVALGLPSDVPPVGGEIHVYRYNSSGRWVWDQQITTQDPASYDALGTDVVLQNGRILSGTPGDENGQIGNGGSIYTFERLGGNWTQTQKLRQSDTRGFDELGTAVDLHGSTAIASTPGRAMAHVFTVDGVALDMEPTVAGGGDTVEFAAFCGNMFAPAFFVLVAVQTQPVFFPIAVVPFGDHSEAVFSTMIPSGLGALSLTFQAFKFEDDGGLSSSQARELILQ